MKLIHAAILSILFLGSGNPAMAGLAPGSGIVGSPHDMNIYSGGDPFLRVCVYCHTPHNAVTSSDAGVTTYLPLWNRAVPLVPLTSYQSANPASITAGSISDPLIGPTRLCWSCHDGVTAIEAHGGSIASVGQWHRLRGDAVIDLSSSHPVGFDYLEVAASINGRTFSASSGNNAEVGGIANPYQGFAVSVDSTTNIAGQYNTVTRSARGGMIADYLYQGRYMTCFTCHDPHNTFNVGQEIFIEGDAAGVQPNFFVRAKLRDSLICLSCHVK
jgi:hypothetical protein